MNDSTLERAVNDIKLIKEVIENDNSSILQLSKTFIYLGLWFLLNGFFDIFFHSFLNNKFPAHTLWVIAYISAAVTLPLLILIFVNAFRTPLTGSGKQIAVIWVFALLFGLVGSSFIVFFQTALNMQFLDNFYIERALQLLSYSFGFLFMSVLSKLKLPGIFAFIYFIFGFFLILPSHPVSDFIYSYLQGISSVYYFLLGQFSDVIGIMVAVTFLIVGYYLKYIKVRRF